MFFHILRLIVPALVMAGILFTGSLVAGMLTGSPASFVQEQALSCPRSSAGPAFLAAQPVRAVGKKR